ncbi:MAG: polysaccharide biosynthesis/export family protein [Bacteroidetes bacterium]|nr:polysaccharide biosynthesis/export family protein [Bacteroidota bacterium]
MQDKTASGDTSKPKESYNEYRIKANDELFIQIQSIDEKVNSYFNYDKTNQYVQTYSGVYLIGYTVNDSGYVYLPTIDKVLVKGLTVNQAKDTIQSKVNQFISGVSVNVKLGNFKITVLGEVNRPGTYYIINSRFTIFEAIGLAGDLNLYGNRLNVKIIHSNDNNRISVVDLTDKKLIYSSEYYLLPNDIIYVEATKSKIYGTNPFPLATIVAAMSTLILLLSYFKK